MKIQVFWGGAVEMSPGFRLCEVHTADTATVETSEQSLECCFQRPQKLGHA